MHVFVVTTVNSNSNMFADIILVTPSDQQAKCVAENIRARRPYPGLDYNLLAPYTDVLVLDREMGTIITNKE